MRTKAHGDGGGKAGRAHAPSAAQRAAAPVAAQTPEPGSRDRALEPIPHRAAMERAFGLSFADVTASTSAGSALDPLGASAATRGTHMAFRASAPRPGQVAHELTHVLQQRQPSSEHGIGAPDGAAEREAARNALRVNLGLAPKLPRERASPDAVYRDVKSDLREAMSGWGTDEEGIYNRLGRATPDEKEAVRSDPALMAELQDELTRSEWVRVLNLLGQGVETQIRESGSGWGTDEEGIYRAVESADVAALQEMLGNGALLLYLRDELTDGELGRVLGSAANTMARDPTVDRAAVFHSLMLFPDSVEEACDRLDAVGGAVARTTAVITALPLGAAMTAQTIADVDTHIAHDGNKTRILTSLTQRWDFGAGRLTTGPVTRTPGATDWSTGLIRQVHAALKMVPPEHVTQVVADITYVGVDPSLKGTTTGGYWIGGGTNVIGLNEDSSGIADTVRHEVGHSIDDLLENRPGRRSEVWKKNALNRWDWGDSLAIWENQMTDPWKQTDGTIVPVADQGPIRTAIESYAKTTDCTQALRAYVRGLSRTHVMLNYWGMDVPVIEAAKSIAGIGGRVWRDKGRMKLDGTTRTRFTWKPNRNDAFLVFDNFVWQNVRNDYALSNHPEFFAVLYEEYYAEGTGDERLSALNVPQWQSFFDTTVHGAR
jgi:hypothetical protein